MRIKKFQGRNMRESIEKMRQELGEEAVILSTREIDENGLTYTELVAGIEPEELALHREQQNRVPLAISHAAGERRNSRPSTEVALNADAPAISRAQFQTARSTPSNKHVDSSSLADLQRQVRELSESVQSLIDQRQHRFSDLLPTHYSQLFRELRAVHFNEEQAMYYIAKLTKTGFNADIDVLRSECKQLIASGITTASPIRIGGERTVILVYGPPGSGKSSVCSKLSSSFALTVNASATILRPAAEAKIDNSIVPKEYAGVQVLRYETSEEFTSLLSQTKDSDFVFVESNIDPRSPAAEQQLHELSTKVQADCVLLTLPVGMHQSTMCTWLNVAKALTNLSIVLTNMDSQSMNGDSLDMIQQRKVAVSFVTDGQHQPQFIKAASPEKIVHALFGVS